MFKQGKTYKELVEIFNKKFNTNKTINGLQQRVSDRKLYTNNGNDKRRRYLNQCPVGTIREHNDGRAIRMLIKIKLIPEDELGLKNYYNKDYWIPYAKYIYENYYNCKLDESETVYHIDGDFRNNSIDNLVVNKMGAYGSAYGKIFGCYKASEEEKAKNEKKIKTAFLIDCVEHQISKLEQE
jgi:hypothetical protein